MARHLTWSLPLILLITAQASAQQGTNCASPSTFTVWLNCEIYRVVQARLNQRNGGKQAEAPSLAANSSTFIDQSSAADLVSVAYNLAGLATNDNSNGTTASVTTTAYALYAAAANQDPLNPRFYNAGKNWRRVSFTLGQEFPEDNVIPQRSNLYGIKILLQDKRDASNWIGELGPINRDLGNSGVAFSKLNSRLQDYLADTIGPRVGLDTSSPAGLATFINQYLGNDEARFHAAIDALKDEELRQISKTVEDNIAPFLRTTDEIRQFVNRKRSAPQFSVAAQTNQRKGDGIDEHRLELIYDRGLFGPATFVVNASYEYKNSKRIGADVRGGRAAAEFQWRLTSDEILTGGKPWMFTVAAEGTGLANRLPAWKVQAKLNVSVPGLNGLEFPISAIYANRTEFVNESRLRARVGFTFDFARLLQGIN